MCVLNFSGRFGGAEKRYATLFNRLMTDGEDYYLVMNTRLYRLLVNSAVLLPHHRIILFNDGGDGVPGKIRNKSVSTGGVKASPGRQFIRFAGSCKYFLKTFLLWLRFSFFFARKVKVLNIKKIYAVWQGGTWTWMWCRLFGIDLVYSVNASGKLMLDTNILKFFDSQYWVLQHASQLDFLSPSLVPAYREAMGYKLRGEVLVTPCSFIDYSNYYPVEPKKPWVVFLGRLEPLKNPDLFLKAVALLADEPSFRKVTFFVMGTGSEQVSLQQFVADRGMKNVVFSGLHPHPWEILQQSSVFVSLQSNENYPSQSLMEAMACENGVVVTDVGDTRKLVIEKEGLLVNTDPAGIAEAIRSLMENPELRKTLGRAAREKVTNVHTLERFVFWFNELMRF
ncbi:glycosyltransferase involved in cell wall biosynthesis [Marinilabilia salmonicolor]|uniref:glycosyltransferase family 4 protein n=1 Tax=Marinilabilia salmonicolor TaxID=989 RepID=UPI000D411A6F|nr:glycosyltransferase family 4 protein [Marinilabilia salmonicolor]PRY96389.1 glycosyltransferase involved in cell wall biosynthesis [Marinilabilia salmonicolor]